MSHKIDLIGNIEILTESSQGNENYCSASLVFSLHIIYGIQKRGSMYSEHQSK